MKKSLFVAAGVLGICGVLSSAGAQSFNMTPPQVPSSKDMKKATQDASKATGSVVKKATKGRAQAA